MSSRLTVLAAGLVGGLTWQVPMRRALSRTLAESLNLYHKTSTETSVHVTRLEDLGLSPAQVSCLEPRQRAHTHTDAKEEIVGYDTYGS